MRYPLRIVTAIAGVVAQSPRDFIAEGDPFLLAERPRTPRPGWQLTVPDVYALTIGTMFVRLGCGPEWAARATEGLMYPSVADVILAGIAEGVAFERAQLLPLFRRAAERIHADPARNLPDVLRQRDPSRPILLIAPPEPTPPALLVARPGDEDALWMCPGMRVVNATYVARSVSAAIAAVDAARQAKEQAA